MFQPTRIEFTPNYRIYGADCSDVEVKGFSELAMINHILGF